MKQVKAYEYNGKLYRTPEEALKQELMATYTRRYKMKPEDSNYILNIVPNFAYGRRQGLSVEETIIKSNQVWHELEDAFEKQVPKKPIESEFTPLICPDCEAKVILGQRYCENCGRGIWMVRKGCGQWLRTN